MPEPRMPKTVKPHELATLIRGAIKEDREQRIRKLKAKRAIRSHIKRLISIPIIIGAVASVVLYLRFGWEVLEQTLLSWTIGLTILAAILAIIEKYGRFYREYL